MHDPEFIASYVKHNLADTTITDPHADYTAVTRRLKPKWIILTKPLPVIAQWFRFPEDTMGDTYPQTVPNAAPVPETE